MRIYLLIRVLHLFMSDYGNWILHFCMNVLYQHAPQIRRHRRSVRQMRAVGICGFPAYRPALELRTLSKSSLSMAK